jgi:hypothetical protein
VLLVLPIQQGFLVISSAINGCIFFNEYTDFNAVSWVAFPAGIAITLAGVGVLVVNSDARAPAAETRPLLAS